MPRRKRFHFLKGLPWKSILIGLAVCVGLALAYRQIDLKAVQERAARLNGFAVFALLTVLPLLGFPVTVVHVAAGIRFGVKLGLILVPVSILLQLLASYALVHLWHDLFARRLATVQKRIPRGAHSAVSIFTVLLPGVPYFAKNYVLPLVGVPLRTYLACCLPIHVVRCALPVILGAKSHELTPARWIAVVAYALILLGVSWWTYRRLRVQLEGRPPAASGRKQSA